MRSITARLPSGAGAPDKTGVAGGSPWLVAQLVEQRWPRAEPRRCEVGLERIELRVVQDSAR
jgi:hypothetical protein